MADFTVFGTVLIDRDFDGRCDCMARCSRGTDEVMARARRELENMMAPHTVRIVQIVVAAVAILFGVATLFAGGRVLLGTDPGYEVFRPLLIYNTAMGVAYLAAGVTVWRRVNVGRYAVGAILLLNFLVLVSTLVVYRSSGAVAVESLRAMTLRTVVWLVLFLAVSWLGRSRTVA